MKRILMVSAIILMFGRGISFGFDFFISAGAEVNGNSYENIAFAIDGSLEFPIKDDVSLGARFTQSFTNIPKEYSDETISLLTREIHIWTRLYFDSPVKFIKSLYLEPYVGIATLTLDDIVVSDNFFSGGVSGGMRIPLMKNFYLDVYVRDGYPVQAAAGAAMVYHIGFGKGSKKESSKKTAPAVSAESPKKETAPAVAESPKKSAPATNSKGSKKR